MSPTSRKKIGGRGSPKFPLRRIMPGRRSDVKAKASTASLDMLKRVRKILHKEEAELDGPVPQRRSSKMKVAVRIRPLNAREVTANTKEIIKVGPPNVVNFDVPTEEAPEFFYRSVLQKAPPGTKRTTPSQFAFDYVYDQDIGNSYIFEDILKPLVGSLMVGFNCSVFAYGATGSGKTYTMLGSDDNPGLTALTVNEIYQQLDSMNEKCESEVQISYLEVYNEEIRDLLNPSTEKLLIREVNNVMEIANLTRHVPGNVESLLEMLRRGNARRSQHPTDHNAESSRSHAVLQIHIRLRERHTDMNTKAKWSKMVMVDLAGSEKGTATGFVGQRFREGASINKSLLALSNCLNALAKGRSAVSFRDSKLTRILKDSLSGNCKTVMIANVSPAHHVRADTLNTLRYADTAKKITCNAKQNVMTVQTCLSEYTRVVAEMSDKILQLEAKVESQEKELERKDLALEIAHREAENLAKTVSDPGPPSSAKSPAPPNGYLRSGEICQKINLFSIGAQTEHEQISLYKITEEKLNNDIDMKKKRLDKLQQLFIQTGDKRYEKGIKRIETFLAKTSKKAERCQQLTTSNLETFNEIWEGVEWKKLLQDVDPLVNILVTDFGKVMKYKALYGSLNLRLEASSEHTKFLTDKIEEQDEQLAEAASALGTSLSLLKHYNHDNPQLTEQYNKFVSSYSGMNNVRFSQSPASVLKTPYRKDGATASRVFSFETVPTGNLKANFLKEPACNVFKKYMSWDIPIDPIVAAYAKNYVNNEHINNLESGGQQGPSTSSSTIGNSGVNPTSSTHLRSSEIDLSSDEDERWRTMTDEEVKEMESENVQEVHLNLSPPSKQSSDSDSDIEYVETVKGAGRSQANSQMPSPCQQNLSGIASARTDVHMPAAQPYSGFSWTNYRPGSGFPLTPPGYQHSMSPFFNAGGMTDSAISGRPRQAQRGYSTSMHPFHTDHNYTNRPFGYRLPTTNPRLPPFWKPLPVLPSVLYPAHQSYGFPQFRPPMTPPPVSTPGQPPGDGTFIVGVEDVAAARRTSSSSVPSVTELVERRVAASNVKGITVVDLDNDGASTCSIETEIASVGVAASVSDFQEISSPPSTTPSTSRGGINSPQLAGASVFNVRNDDAPSGGGISRRKSDRLTTSDVNVDQEQQVQVPAVNESIPDCPPGMLGNPPHVSTPSSRGRGGYNARQGSRNTPRGGHHPYWSEGRNRGTRGKRGRGMRGNRPFRGGY